MANKKWMPPYADLDKLSTRALEEIIRADYLFGNLDQDFVMRALEVIAERKQLSEDDTFNVDDAWETFKNEYWITEGDGLSLYDSTPPPGSGGVDTPHEGAQEKVNHVFPDDEPGKSPRRVRRTHRVGRVLLIAVLSVAVMFGSLFTAQAMGIDVFGRLARWTDDVFRFEASNPVSNTKLSDALSICHMDAGLIPSWNPEGFAAEEPVCDEQRSGTYITQRFANEDGRNYKIKISRYTSPEYISGKSFEKDSSSVEEHISNGRLVYVFSNLERNTATWSDGVFEISIFGDLTRTELKQIFDSIGGTA